MLAILAAVRRARPVRYRDKPVDHQETSDHPNPALMTQTPGVGTITFDTTMGETMVSSKIKAERYHIAYSGGKIMVFDENIKDWKEQHAAAKPFRSEQDAQAWIDEQTEKELPEGSKAAIQIATRAVMSVGKAERQGFSWEPELGSLWVEFDGDRFGGSSFYTPRRGEEDDDWPDFTGGPKIRDALQKAFASPIDGVQWESHVRNNEKGYFTVLLKPAGFKPTASRIKAGEELVDAALAILRRLDTMTGAEFDAGAADADIEALRATLDPYLFG
jgi:hypothetical protein